jgi:uncharacterized protein (TIGR03084 family)
MSLSMADLSDDLLAETADLEAMLIPLDPSGWDKPTPAVGWAIRDQVSHLAFFDDAAITAVVDPDRFRSDRKAAFADPDGMDYRSVMAHRGLTGTQLLDWLHRARTTFVETVRPLDPRTRVPWYGPEMSIASAVTARIMETWAHGQDVADGLGIQREPTNRLRHVAFIGARTLPNSYRTKGLLVPETPVHVELTSPTGEVWTFGPDDVADRVSGTALDFCLVVTQRRHVDDTDLAITGPVATEWLSIAQAFAGPSGAGRQPGQFLKQGARGPAEHRY